MPSHSKDQNIIKQRVSSTSDLKKKVILYTRVLRLDPNHFLTYSEWAINLLIQKQYAKAKEKWKRVIQITPDRLPLYYKWMSALFFYREFEGVLLLVEKYPERLFKYQINNTVGVCFLHLGDYENAIKHFKNAAHEEKFRVYYSNWALALYLQGEKEEALELYGKAEQMDDGGFSETFYEREMNMLKEDLKREGSKGLEDLIKKNIEAFQYFIDMKNEGGK